MNIASLITRSALSCGLALALASCGGGGGGDAAPAAKPRSVSGTAAVGRPLAGSTVTLKGANGRTAKATTASDGSFLFPDVSLFTWPLVAQVEGGNVGCVDDPVCQAFVNLWIYTAISIIQSDGDDTTINLTPVADAIVGAATGTSPAEVFLRPELLAGVTPQRILDAQTKVFDWLKKLDPLLTLPTGTNFLTDPFRARPTDRQDQTLDSLDAVLTALGLTPQQFSLLTRGSTTTPAVPIYCDVAGSYTGSYTGNDQGTWTATIDAYSGQILANGRSTQIASLTFHGEGLVTRLGIGTQRTSGGVGFAGVAVFAGNISDAAAFTGNWTNPLQRGTFSGQRQARATGCN